MINVETIHNDIRSMLKKYNSYFLSPENIDIAINKAKIDVLQATVTAYEESSNRFMGDQELLVIYPFTGVGSERTLPDDVFKVSVVLMDDNEGDLLDSSTFNGRLKSSIIPPTVLRPIATVYNDNGKKIRILPSGDGHKIKYWKIPVDCKYNYTVTNGNVSFNPTGSVNLGMPMSSYTDIVNRTLTYLSPAAKDVDAANLEQNILK